MWEWKLEWRIDVLVLCYTWALANTVALVYAGVGCFGAFTSLDIFGVIR